MTQEEFFKRYNFNVRSDKIGGGSFGTVYKAYDNVIDQRVAIKVAQVQEIGGKTFSLHDELQAISDLKEHTNLAVYDKVYTFESPQGIFDYAVMMYYPDGNLSDYLKKNKSLSQQQRESLCIGILEGIGHLHDNNVVHRDLKPGNILVKKRESGEVIPKITDFGLSKKANADGKGSRFTNSFAGGTLQYSSPEQIRGEALKLNTDLWSFAVIAYEILTGKTLFQASGYSAASAEWQNKISEQILQLDTSSLLKELPEKWEAIIKACSKRDPNQRIKQVADIRELYEGDEALKTKVLNHEDDTSNSKTNPQDSIKKATRNKDSLNDEDALKLLGLKKAFSIATLEKSYRNNKKDLEKQKKSITGQNVKEALQKEIEQLTQAYTQLKPLAEGKAKTKKPAGWIVGIILVLIAAGALGYFQPWVPDPDVKEKFIELKGQGDILTEKQDWSHALEKYQAAFELIEDKEVEDSIASMENRLANITEQEDNKAEDADWNSAKQKNTTNGYEAYIDKYPEGQFVTQAQKEIEDLKNKAIADEKAAAEAKAKAEAEAKAKAEAEKAAKQWNPGKDIITKDELTEWVNTNGLNEITKAANNGHKIAQRRLARIYDYGSGVKENNTKAVKWYRKAIKKGDAIAINNLGVKYDRGEGVSQNSKKAVYWFKKSAEKGDEVAMKNLGVHYRDGDGVTKDYEKANFWLRKSAEKGYAGAMHSLGYSYDKGRGVTKDYEKANYWFRKAAEKGDADAMFSLGINYKNGDGVTKDYEKANYWYKKSAEKGNASAMNSLGYSYYNGRGLTKDYEKANYWYKKSAEKGNATGMNNLGFNYANGNGVSKNYKKANYWYRKAADEGYASAMFSLGVAYENGYGVAKDYKKAVYWYRKAGEDGDTDGMYNLANCYYEGLGVTKDYKKAVYWLKKASDEGDAGAMNNLGFCYKNGIGVAKDEEKANYWFKKAKENGY